MCHLLSSRDFKIRLFRFRWRAAPAPCVWKKDSLNQAGTRGRARSQDLLSNADDDHGLIILWVSGAEKALDILHH